MIQKLHILISLLGFALTAQAQTALYNSGNIRIHENGQLGFHTDLINDAGFDENLGLVGFYGDIPLFVSGAFIPTFFDVEISNDASVVLNTGINSVNNTNFVAGDFFTERDRPENYYNFLQNAFYIGDSDISKVDGFAGITNQQNFVFPVGDFEQLRPLILNSQTINNQAKCAYFFEDPNTPSTFNTNFDTERKTRDIITISVEEFWRLEGTVPATIGISWNERSNIAALTDDATTIVAVGWSKIENQWVNLGNTALAGDLAQGFVTSDLFNPNDFEIITFGSIDPNVELGEPSDILTLDNYLVTPNGDGANDFLLIPELEQSPNNTLRIYNRFGSKVFEIENYTNQFTGFANTNNFVLNREKGLPIGVYFYTVSMHDLGFEFQGFLYLAR